MNRRRRWAILGLGLLLGLGAGLWWGLLVFRSQLEPMPEGESRFVRFESRATMRDALKRLQEEGIVRNGNSAWWYARWEGRLGTVRDGTYELQPGMTVDEVLDALQEPMQQMVRLPEGRWIAWTAQILEENQVCEAEEYIALTALPEEFADLVEFPLPQGSLEGYLYPDTYDLPPLLGARGVIERQLRAFEQKVWDGLEPKPGAEELKRAVIIGSLIELEVAADEERPIVAGVIENRLASERPYLELDATVLYGIQEWRVLGPGEVRNLPSPFNTYLNPGLPPGPIGNPSARSILAAFSPAEHEYFFYVARPGGVHYFSETYAQHIQNIRTARAEFAALNSDEDS